MRKRRSDAKTHETFVEEMREKHPEIDVIGYYKDQKTKISFKCMKCNKVWEAKPTTLLQGSKCSCTRRLTHKEFLKRIPKHIELLEEYEGAFVKLKAKCAKCGYIWRGLPRGLAEGSCMGCFKKKVTKSNRMFAENMSERFPEIEVLSEYKTGKKKLLFRCKTCGNTWRTTPDVMLRKANGKGCPKCVKEKCTEKLTKSHSSFVKEMGKVNPSILIFSRYEKDGVHVKCRCDIGRSSGLEKRERLDRIKTKYCEKNEIGLLRIPYFEYRNIENILYRQVVSKPVPEGG